MKGTDFHERLDRTGRKMLSRLNSQQFEAILASVASGIETHLAASGLARQ
jgi:hypothetical protein